jgi:hypothetical protein
MVNGRAHSRYLATLQIVLTERQTILKKLTISKNGILSLWKEQNLLQICNYERHLFVTRAWLSG